MKLIELMTGANVQHDSRLTPSYLPEDSVDKAQFETFWVHNQLLTPSSVFHVAAMHAFYHMHIAWDLQLA
jgi:hypothetical protein